MTATLITPDGTQFTVTTTGVDRLIKSTDRVVRTHSNGSQAQYQAYKGDELDYVVVVNIRSEAGELLEVASRTEVR